MEGTTIAADLRRVVAGEVRFDAGSRALYATDASNYRQVPIGVVVPRDAADVEAALGVARRHGAPVLGRGAGTSLAGQCCNAGIVLDFSKYMNRIVGIDAGARRARVQPGVTLDVLRDAAAVHGLTFGPDPATHRYCTLGGMIGNNSCGVHSVMADLYGPGPTTADNVEELEIVTYRGERMRVGGGDLAEGGPRAAPDRRGELLTRVDTFERRYADAIRREFPRIPRRVSGYNLPALLPENGRHVARALVGSESTLALVLEATVLLIPARPHRVLVVLGFEDVFAAADHVPEVMQYGPVGLEGMDDKLVEDLRKTGLGAGHLRLLPDGRGWLIVEFGAESPDEAMAQARACAEAMRRKRGAPSVALLDAPEDQHGVWEIRESGLAATAHVSGEHPTWPGWEDSAVPPERFGAYLRELSALLQSHGYDADLYGHFGQGCLHCRIGFDLRSPDGIATYRSFVERAADLVHRYGGSLSGEHGDGQARGELLPRMFGPETMQAFRELKSIWDPDGKLNPGKVVDALPLDANLRLASEGRRAVKTWFAFSEEGGSFARATTRCVGVGKCRKTGAGTMCPSYMVTMEEKHTTRGRARLLFEMLAGDPIDAGWQSEEVHEALDLCLSCKGCKRECPVHVDMATYKAEFLAHYYEGHRRPRSAYAFGWIRTWAELASRAPRLVNSILRMPGADALARLGGGVAPRRRLPRFAPETFRQWFLRRPLRAGGGPQVILWPDTFNDHFHPETLRAAVHVLEHAGFTVTIPRAPLCCGRPLYDFGMLGPARRHLERILESLAREIASGIPVVGLEPSCVSVFRDELTNMVPDRELAGRLRDQTFTLAEVLTADERHASSFRLSRRAIAHGHCHHKAIVTMQAEQRLFAAMGLRSEILDSGCCGMAGAFGFERGHYEVSMAIGERVLLPAVRAADRDAFIVADGFSCREQIAQGTDRRAMHLAELLSLAIEHGPNGPAGDLPERRYVRDYADATLQPREIAAGAAWVAGFGLAAAALGRRRM